MGERDYTTEFDELKRRRRSRRSVDFFLRTYSWIGVFLAIVAAGYFLLTLLSFELSGEQQVALMVAGVGVLLSLMSRTLIVFYKERDAEESDYAEEYDRLSFFLETWAQFERVSKKALAEQEDDSNVYSFRSVISRLYADGKIDKEDVTILEEGLKTRNAIVHGDRSRSTKVTQRVTDSLAEVIRKL